MKKTILVFFITFLTGSVYSQNMPIPTALKSYLEIAMKENPQIQASQARWRNTDAKVTEAASYLYPSVDFTARLTAYDGGRVIDIPGIGPVNTAGLGVVPYDTKFEATWPIGNYAVWQGVSTAEAFLDASTAQVDATQRDISMQVSQAYFNYAKATALVEVRKNQLALAEENLKLTRALFAADKVAKNDVLRAEVSVANAESDVVTTRRYQIVAQTAFNTMLMRKSDAPVQMLNADEAKRLSTFIDDIVDDPNKRDQRMALPDLRSDLDNALRERPEVRQLTSTEAGLEGTKKINAAGFFPNISLYGSYGWLEENLKLSSQSDLLVGALVFKWNLFSGFGTKAKVDQAQAQIEEIRFQRQALQNGIQVELESARSEKVSAIQRLALNKKILASAEENYRITKLQYDNGTAQLINLLDAQFTLGNSNTNYTDAVYDMLIAEIKYKRALGIEIK
jgi:outer membrane protein